MTSSPQVPPCGNAFRRRKSENFTVFIKIAIGGCAIGKVPHRQLFSRKGTEPVNNTRYTLDIVVCRYYERDQRFKRFLVKNANARRTGKAYPKPFVGCKRGPQGQHFSRSNGFTPLITSMFLKYLNSICRLYGRTRGKGSVLAKIYSCGGKKCLTMHAEYDNITH